MRISFLGDTMCEPLLLARSQTNDGQYDFTKSFSLLEGLFVKSDYVVCNLETPLAGQEAGYTDSLFSFNAPVEFGEALRICGVNLALTANNHCLDRGEQGALATLEALDRIGLDHTGTFIKTDSSNYFVAEIGKSRIAFVSYTYGTNYVQNHESLSQDSLIAINLLSEIETPPGQKPTQQTSNLIKKIILKLVPHETRIKIKRKLGMPYYHAYKDDYFLQEAITEPLAGMIDMIHEAKQEADYVVLCPHMGGQFNRDPGAFSNLVMDLAIENNCDAVIASHPHVVQKAEFINDVPCFFSLGNCAMSPNSPYILPDNLPQYGIVAHIEFPDTSAEPKPRTSFMRPKASFSIICSVEKERDVLKVWPLKKLYENADNALQQRLLGDAKKIVEIVTGKRDTNATVLAEYPLG